MKEGAEPREATTTNRAEPPQEQVDPVLFGTYQEKLYVEVSPAKASIFVSWVCSLLVSLHCSLGAEVSVKLGTLTNVCP